MFTEYPSVTAVPHPESLAKQREQKMFHNIENPNWFDISQYFYHGYDWLTINTRNLTVNMIGSLLFIGIVILQLL